MHNGAVLTSELVKLAEQTESDEAQLQTNFKAIDGCAGSGKFNT
jgi:hypothetical protein